MALQNHVLGAGPTRQFIPGAGPSSNFPPLPDARRIGERSQGSTLGLRRGLPSSNRPGGAIGFRGQSQPTPQLDVATLEARRTVGEGDPAGNY